MDLKCVQRHLLSLIYSLSMTISFSPALFLEEATYLTEILLTYDKVFRHKINLDKSMLAFSRNIHSFRIDDFERLMGVKTMGSFSKYTRLPTIVRRSKKQTFQFIPDCVWKKLKSWMEKVLSRARCEVLIKFVVQSIPSHMMGYFLLP